MALMEFFPENYVSLVNGFSSVNVSHVNSLSRDLAVSSPPLLAQPSRVSRPVADQPVQCARRQLGPFPSLFDCGVTSK